MVLRAETGQALEGTGLTPGQTGAAAALLDATEVIVGSDRPLSEQELAKLASDLGEVGGVERVRPPEVSEDGTAARSLNYE